jgi:HEAT repeat protein
VLALLAALAACQTTTETAGSNLGQPQFHVVDSNGEPENIGFFLTRFDLSLAKWSELRLSAASARDQNALLALEANLEESARLRREELLEVLASGAPANRRVAAAALGFTHDPSVLGALLALLPERDPELVQKALLGIGILALADTPLAAVRKCLAEALEPWTRNNAAFVLLAVARAGNSSPELVEACRAGLGDSEPGVRAQCASALGAAGDPSAVVSLIPLLEDGANLAALAAAVSLARLGRMHLEQKGSVGRALAALLERAPPDRRAQLLGALRWLSELNLGEDAGPWLEWAHKLP